MTSSQPRSRFVRQFALTGGRARSSGTELPFETLVRATTHGKDSVASLGQEQAAILRLCSTPISIAEISAHLHIHLGIARVLIGDMGEADYVSISEPTNNANGPDTALLERLLHELEAL